LPEAEAVETAAIEILDLWLWLLQEVRLALDPITPCGHIPSASRALVQIEVALELMTELGRDDVTKFALKVDKYLDDLVLLLVELETSLEAVRANLSPDDEKLITWVWQHRQELNSPWPEFFPATWQVTTQAFYEAFSLFHRASSLAESIHAWVRPYLQIHRGMPQWLAPLLQLFWNHHRFQRGKRAGFTQSELAGMSDSPTLSQIFAALSESKAIPAMC
jgi:hypothetical protein